MIGEAIIINLTEMDEKNGYIQLNMIQIEDPETKKLIGGYNSLHEALSHQIYQLHKEGLIKVVSGDFIIKILKTGDCAI